MMTEKLYLFVDTSQTAKRAVHGMLNHHHQLEGHLHYHNRLDTPICCLSLPAEKSFSKMQSAV
jgi:hypothetical protein